MKTGIPTIETTRGNEEIARNFRKALLTAIVLHIILLYAFVESKPVEHWNHSGVQATLIIIHSLPDKTPPTPAPAKPPVSRNSRPAPAPPRAAPKLPPKIVPASLAINPGDIVVEPPDLQEIDFPVVELPFHGPYSVSYPGIVPPRCTHRVMPDYPAPVRRLGLKGMVVLSVIIDAGGHPVNARVLRSFNEPSDKAAIEAVMQWHFEPATLNDVPVPVEMVLTIQFVTK